MQGSPHKTGRRSPNFMNMDGVDCNTRSPISPGENFDSPLKNERIMKLSESGSTKGKQFGLNKKSQAENSHEGSFGNDNISREVIKGKSPFRITSNQKQSLARLEEDINDM